MVAYDSDIIKRVAADLYRQADMTVLFYIIMGLIIGGVGGVGGAKIVDIYEGIGVGMGVAGGFYIGYQIGTAKAFIYKFQAQMLLVLVQIEFNTRSQ